MDVESLVDNECLHGLLGLLCLREKQFVVVVVYLLRQAWTNDDIHLERRVLDVSAMLRLVSYSART